MLTLFTFGAVGILVVFNRSFLRAYDSAFGQVMMALVGAMFSLGFFTLHQLGRLPTTERVLTATPRPLAAADGGRTT